MAGELDPLLPLIVLRRGTQANNQFRAKLLADAAASFRRNPEGFRAFVLQHLEWAQAEAIARDRAGQELEFLPLSQPEQKLLPALVAEQS